MTLADEIRTVVDQPIVAVIGTRDAKGRPHLAAVWYLRQGDELLVVTPESARKVANIKLDPAVELCINAGPVGPCVTAHGSATVSGPASAELLSQLAERYLGPDGAARYLAQRDPAARSVVLSIVAHRWRTWGLTGTNVEGRISS